MELKTKNYIVVHTIETYGENDYATLSVIQLVPKFSIKREAYYSLDVLSYLYMEWHGKVNHYSRIIVQ